jgi:hypothetical protein
MPAGALALSAGRKLSRIGSVSASGAPAPSLPKRLGGCCGTSLSSPGCWPPRSTWLAKGHPSKTKTPRQGFIAKHRALDNFRKLEWTNAECARAGDWLIRCTENLDLFELDERGLPKIARDHQAAIDEFIEQEVFRHPLCRPSLTPPRWTSWRTEYTDRISATFLKTDHPETVGSGREGIRGRRCAPGREGSDAFPSVETTRLHYAARRRDFLISILPYNLPQNDIFVRLCLSCNTSFRANRLHSAGLLGLPTREGVVMGRTRFHFGEGGVRKGIAIAGVLVAWWLTLGSEPAKAQTGSCNISPDGFLTCSFSTAAGLFSQSCNASGFCTVTCPNGGRIAVQAAGQTADQILAAIIPQASACFGGTTSLQNAAQAARQISQVSMTAVQSQLQSIRDSIQARRRRAMTTGRPIGFAGEPSSDRLEKNPLYDGGFQDVLAYTRTDSKSPLYQAPAAAPATAASPPVWSVWGQGFGDWENRNGTANGIDIGRRTLTGGGLVGLDVTFSNFTSPSGALVLGVLGAGMRSTTHNADGSEARVDGPGTGFYAIYVNGGFSTDATWKGDFLTVAPSTLPTSVGLNNYVTAWNIQQKFEWGPSWIEPTAGFTYTNSIWNAAGHAQGFTDGYAWRVQGGLRAGTSWDAGGGVKLEPTVTALAYDDVKISGGTLAVTLAPLAPTDQDKVFGLFSAKLNADYGHGLSAYVEGEVRGRTGVLGSAVRAGIRKSLQ